MKVLNFKFREYIIPYFNVITANFKDYPNAAYLYAVEISTSLFHRDTELVPYLIEIYNFMCKCCFDFFECHNKEENIDIMEDLFGMLFRFAKYIPQAIVSSDTLDINLELAERAIGIKEHDLAKALYLFLEYLCKLCTLYPEDEIEQVEILNQFNICSLSQRSL